MNILLLEDEPDAAQTLLRLFRAAGHDLTLCDNGKQGLFLLTTQEFDGVLVDLVLPQLSGWEVIDAVKAELAHKRVPLIVVSGYAWVVPKETFAGVPVVTKPYDFNHLLRLCEKTFQRPPRKRS